MNDKVKYIYRLATAGFNMPFNYQMAKHQINILKTTKMPMKIKYIYQLSNRNALYNYTSNSVVEWLNRPTK